MEIRSALSALVLLWCVCCVASEVLKEDSSVGLRVRVEVPRFAVAGAQATLACSFLLKGAAIYSLKWYHNGTEFYRFVPTEKTHGSFQSSSDFSVTEVFRGQARVTLALARLAPSASGRYLCEVLAEHPSFLKETVTGEMTVLQAPLSPPVVAGGRRSYRPHEVIEVKCRPRHASPPGHTPRLHWLIDGRQVAPELVSSLPSRRPDHASGLALHLPATMVVAAGGSVRAECRISLGPHARPHSTFLTLVVRDAGHTRPDSYLSAAGGSAVRGGRWLGVVVLSGVVVALS
ncbi:hypothetical protein GWK47_000585 [Chionoecetes opilio]|uniref:Ig-like domain-containing protein n=1 Tax=Chionoecetes opilio TaxID=41210 RepID=A0A8J4Y772_CHIOP|nr:hypothetical protein GWK47_000585 [Chionoecetes opilio]